LKIVRDIAKKVQKHSTTLGCHNP